MNRCIYDLDKRIQKPVIGLWVCLSNNLVKRFEIDKLAYKATGLLIDNIRKWLNLLLRAYKEKKGKQAPKTMEKLENIYICGFFKAKSFSSVARKFF